MAAMRAGGEVGPVDVLAVAASLRWDRPDLTAALADHLLEAAVAARDRDTWLAAAGWAVHARAAVGDGRAVAADLVEVLSSWDEVDLEAPVAHRLRTELAVVAVSAGEVGIARTLLRPVLDRHDDPVLRADALCAFARCAIEDAPDEVADAVTAAEEAWAAAGGPGADLGIAGVALVDAVARRRSGRGDEAADRSGSALARLDRGRRSRHAGVPPAHLAAALAAEWISALLDAGRVREARERCDRIAPRFSGPALPSRQLARLRLTIARVVAGDAATHDAAAVLVDAARDATDSDAPDLEALCRAALAAVQEQSGRSDEATESQRLGAVAAAEDGTRAARFRTALAHVRDAVGSSGHGHPDAGHGEPHERVLALGERVREPGSGHGDSSHDDSSHDDSSHEPHSRDVLDGAAWLAGMAPSSGGDRGPVMPEVEEPPGWTPPWDGLDSASPIGELLFRRLLDGLRAGSCESGSRQSGSGQSGSDQSDRGKAGRDDPDTGDSRRGDLGGNPDRGDSDRGDWGRGGDLDRGDLGRGDLGRREPGRGESGPGESGRGAAGRHDADRLGPGRRSSGRTAHSGDPGPGGDEPGGDEPGGDVSDRTIGHDRALGRHDAGRIQARRHRAGGRDAGRSDLGDTEGRRRRGDRGNGAAPHTRPDQSSGTAPGDDARPAADRHPREADNPWTTGLWVAGPQEATSDGGGPGSAEPGSAEPGSADPADVIPGRAELGDVTPGGRAGWDRAPSPDPTHHASPDHASPGDAASGRARSGPSENQGAGHSDAAPEIAETGEPRAGAGTGDDDGWLSAALAELDKVWGRPFGASDPGDRADTASRAVTPESAAAQSSAAGPAAVGADAEGCVVAVDVSRDGRRFAGRRAADVLQAAADRLREHLPTGARLRYDSDTVSVVLAGWGRAPATDWMHRTLPGLLDGYESEHDLRGMQLRAGVHDTDGPVGAQLLQRLEDSSPRSRDSHSSADDILGIGATDGRRSGSAALDTDRAGDPNPAARGNRRHRAAGQEGDLGTSRRHTSAANDGASGDRPAGSVGRHGVAERPPFRPETVQPGSGGRRRRRTPDDGESHTPGEAADGGGGSAGRWATPGHPPTNGNGRRAAGGSRAVQDGSVAGGSIAGGSEAGAAAATGPVTASSAEASPATPGRRSRSDGPTTRSSSATPGASHPPGTSAMPGGPAASGDSAAPGTTANSGGSATPEASATPGTAASSGSAVRSGGSVVSGGPAESGTSAVSGGSVVSGTSVVSGGSADPARSGMPATSDGSAASDGSATSDTSTTVGSGSTAGSSAAPEGERSDGSDRDGDLSTEGMGLADLLAGALAAYRGI